MIQRKQSIFLLVAAICTAILALGNMAEFISSDITYVLKYTGIYSAESAKSVLFTYPLAVLIVASTMLSVSTLFLFKKRALQLRLCGINIAFAIGIAAFIFYFGHVGQKSLDSVVVYKWIAVMPFVSIVMLVLAMIAIAKDEALVKSLNRIR